MRSHCGVYVDAGYLLASAATRVTGTSLRNGITVEYPRLIASYALNTYNLSDSIRTQLRRRLWEIADAQSK